jgi:hypothetical protein
LCAAAGFSDAAWVPSFVVSLLLQSLQFTIDNLAFAAVLRIRDVYPGSRILIFTHPGSRIPDLGSRIPDPKTATKERGGKKLVVIPFYVATNFTKL